jgi:hypothetical protein
VREFYDLRIVVCVVHLGNIMAKKKPGAMA